jgi:hypothetical protein
MKICSMCREYKDESEFYYNKKALDKLTYLCKSCMIKHQRQYNRIPERFDKKEFTAIPKESWDRYLRHLQKNIIKEVE